MALKEIVFTVPEDGGDDAGKVFLITRMDAITGDKWGRHVIQAAIKSGAQIPQSAVKAGIAGIAGMALTIFGSIDPAEGDRLLDQLLDCVLIIPDPGTPAVRRKWHPGDFAEIQTVSLLHQEAFKLHTGFFQGASRLLSPIISALVVGLASSPPNAPTSAPSSSRSSRRGSRRSTS